jgi:hypothetical protein
VPKDRKTQHWFRLDAGYLEILSNLYHLEGVNYDYKASRVGFTFTVLTPGLEGVTFQLTKNDKFCIFAPGGVEIDQTIEKVKPFLDKAAGRPVRLAPYTTIGEREATQGVRIDVAGLAINVKMGRNLRRCYRLIENASALFKKFPRRRRYHIKYDEMMEDLASHATTVRRLLDKLKEPPEDEELKANREAEKEEQRKLRPLQQRRMDEVLKRLVPQPRLDSNGMYIDVKDFRLGERSSIGKILNECQSLMKRTEVLKTSKGDAGETFAFVSEVCSFVERKLREAATIGLELRLDAYTWEMKKHTIVMRVSNYGDDEIDVAHVYIDAPNPSVAHPYLIHVVPNPVPVDGTSTVEVYDAKAEEGSFHRVAVVADWVEFPFELKAGGMQKDREPVQLR